VFRPQDLESIDGFRLCRPRPGVIRRLWPLRRIPEADLTMIVAVLYAAGAIGVSVYMLVALLRPDKF
jgi:hypothetical protein